MRKLRIKNQKLGIKANPSRVQISPFYNSNSAFSLIELLVVIAIIAILLAVSAFGLQGSRASARDAKRKSDLEAIRSALELYKSDHNYYPLRVNEASGWEVSNDGDWLENLDSEYMQDKLLDPINDSTRFYRYAVCNNVSTSWVYVGGVLVGQKNYKIQAFMETTTNTKQCLSCDGYQGGSGWECLINP